MKVLVTYASRHGSTAGIAERIADRLRKGGLSVDLHEVGDLRHIDEYDAFVIGGAAYMFHWMKEVTSFVKKHKSLLRERPVWLFSSGPLGTELVDEKGDEVLETSRPKEFDELAELLHPRDEQVFFGKWDPGAPPVGMAERFIRMTPTGTSALPAGDCRDWDAIDTWADGIMRTLTAM